MAPTEIGQLLKAYNPAQITAMVRTAAQFTHNVAQFNAATAMAGKSIKKKAVQTENTNAKATRPLNSWMAFRAYYSPIFAGLQQKEISGFMTQLWSEDPLKAKWSILAKAYSMIRDAKGKKSAPLDSFLAINGPFIGVIAPLQYFDTLGWNLHVINGQVSFSRNSSFTTAGLEESVLTTNLSVEDVIANSVANDYFVEYDGSLKTSMNLPAMAMATSSQGVPSASGAYDATEQILIGSTVALSTESLDQNGSVGAGENEAEEDDDPIEHLNDDYFTDNGASSYHVPKHLTSAPAKTTQDDNPVERLNNDYFMCSGEPFFYDEYHVDAPSFVFDPYSCDDFNAYSISDFHEGYVFDDQDYWLEKIKELGLLEKGW